MVLKACQEKGASQTNGSSADSQQSNGAGSSDSSMKPPEEKRVRCWLALPGVQIILLTSFESLNFNFYFLVFLDAASGESNI